MYLVTELLLKLQNAGIYTNSDFDQLKVWCEEAANMLVWSWGFKEETRAIYQEFPEAPRPRWYVDLQPIEEEDLSSEEVF
jgi:hypothetical protein